LAFRKKTTLPQARIAGRLTDFLFTLPTLFRTMKNEEKNLNTESNDIAGNPVGGPAGNTAAKPLPVATSPSGGSPTQLPTPASVGSTNPKGAKGPTSNELLASAEMSVGKGGLGSTSATPANKTAEPARRGRKPGSTNKAKAAAPPSPKAQARGAKQGSGSSQPEAYGGNFGNDVQDSSRDHDRRSNQNSAADRGEFGAQSHQGGTHGGFGNQYREFDYERHNSAEDRYYGGPGRYGPQHNAYRDYDGRDEGRPARGYYYDPGRRAEPGYDHRPEYDRPRFSAGYGNDYYNDRQYQNRQYQSGSYDDGRGNRYDNRNQPDRADPYSGRQNDNGSRQGRGGGYADDYGRSSVRGNPYGERRPSWSDESYEQRGGYGGRRNQDEDYRSSRGGYDNQGSAGGRGGRRDEDYGYRSYNDEQRGQRPDYSRGYGDRGRDEARYPNYRTGDDRNGYGQSYGGDSSEGYGSRGGSYNDNYEDSQPGSRRGPAGPGNYRREDADRNYGPDRRREYRGDDDQTDYGSAPRRNAGRDEERED
jgi:hypothetical protein